MEAADIAHATGNQLGVNLLEAADGLCIGQHQGDAVDNGLSAQGCNEGGHMELCNNQAVDQAYHKANGKDNQQHQEDVHFGNALPHPASVVAALTQNTGNTGCQTHLTTGGQVSALGNQAAGHAQCNQETDGGVA